VNISQIAVRRPVTVVMIVVGIIVMGFVALSRLSVDLLPDIEIPAAAVITTYEGAGPYEVENLVTRPVEEALATVANVTAISSQSERGRSTVVVEFAWGTDMDFALLDMRERLDMVKPFLPEDADSPRPLKFNPNDSPIFEAALSGDRTGHELREIASTRIKNQLERLNGVAAVDIVGGREREIRISLDPGKLKAYGISLDQVANALRASNINLPGGRITEGSREYTIRTEGEYETVDEIRDVVVTAGAAGVRKLKDIARVEDTFKESLVLTRVNGQESVGILVRKEAKANTVEVAELVKSELRKLSAVLGDDLRITFVADNSTFVRSAIDTVTSNAIAGGLLAVVVLLVFLQSVGTTLIISLAIPISIIATFMLIYFNDMTLNMMSLGGLALGTGMLVDNAIVVLENIFRRSESGEKPVDAAVNGASQVSMAITASTLTTVAVFLPVVFIEGIASEIFTDLSITVTFSLLSSLVVSLTLIPMLGSRFGTRVSTPPAGDESTAGKRANFIVRLLDTLSHRYSQVLARALRHRWIPLTGAFAVLLSTLPVIGMVGQEFLPSVDEGTISIRLNLETGTVLSETDKVVAELERKIGELDYVDTVLSQVGSESRGEVARLTVKMVPFEERSVSTEQAMEDIRRLARAYPEAEAKVSPVDSVTGGMSGAPLQIELRAADRDLLENAVTRVAAAVEGVEGIRDVETSIEDARPELEVKVKREKASTYGLAVYQVASAVRASVNGEVATRYRTGGDEIDVVVKLDDGIINDPDSMGQIPISTPYGTIIPLKEIASVIPCVSPDIIQRSDQERMVSVSAEISGRDLGSVIRDCEQVISDINLNPEIDVLFTGDNKWMVDAMSDLSQALVLAVFLVYVILASQFESFWQPLAILLSIPLAFVGVIWVLAATGHTLNVASFIGVIMLAGIVVNNAIVLIDYVNQNRRRGMTRDEAVEEAGRTRFRPILMTTTTTVLGLTPLAIGIGPGAELEQPIAITVIGGLSLSTLLTLFVIPLMYTLLDDMITRVREVYSEKAPGFINRLPGR